jgi:hypothetical protein
MVAQNGRLQLYEIKPEHTAPVAAGGRLAKSNPGLHFTVIL